MKRNGLGQMAILTCSVGDLAVRLPLPNGNSHCISITSRSVPYMYYYFLSSGGVWGGGLSDFESQSCMKSSGPELHDISSRGEHPSLRLETTVTS